MKTTKTVRVSAATATYTQLCKLPRDNWSAGDYWLITDTAEVTLCHQKLGESPKESVTISRRKFNLLLRGYLRKAAVGRHAPRRKA